MNIYVCPTGHTLHPHTPTENYTCYAIKDRACKTCPLRETCMSGVSKSRSAKYIHRSAFQDQFDQLRRRQKTAKFKNRLRQRSWKIEGVFAELKENHNLRRAHYRGRANMQIQMYMIAVVHNLKRFISAFYQIFVMQLSNSGIYKINNGRFFLFLVATSLHAFSNIQSF